MSRPVRVLVTGAGGQVGADLVDTLRGDVPLGADPSFQPDNEVIRPDEFEVLGLTHHELDITDPDMVDRALRASRPDVVVHLAAYTAVDRAETESEVAYAVNEGGTGSLSRVCHELGAHLIAVSTDYVFNGRKGAAYVETDTPDPLSVYGASKLAGERVCRVQDTIVRTSWVMGVRGKNVLHVIADRAQSGEHVRFVRDQAGTVTSAADLARSLVTMVRERPGGVWHVANSEMTTWYEIAAYTGTVLGRGDDFAIPIETSELSPAPLAARPQRSDLATEKWQSSGWRALPNWREAVTRLALDRQKLPRG